MCAAYNKEKDQYNIEIELPGIKKDKIDLKVLSGGFIIKALKGDIEYHGDYTFCCPVDTDKTEAKYDNGLLTINTPLKDPYTGAKKVHVK